MKRVMTLLVAAVLGLSGSMIVAGGDPNDLQDGATYNGTRGRSGGGGAGVTTPRRSAAPLDVRSDDTTRLTDTADITDEDDADTLELRDTIGGTGTTGTDTSALRGSTLRPGDTTGMRDTTGLLEGGRQRFDTLNRPGTDAYAPGTGSGVTGRGTGTPAGTGLGGDTGTSTPSTGAGGTETFRDTTETFRDTTDATAPRGGTTTGMGTGTTSSTYGTGNTGTTGTTGTGTGTTGSTSGTGTTGMGRVGTATDTGHTHLYDSTRDATRTGTGMTGTTGTTGTNVADTGASRARDRGVPTDTTNRIGLDESGVGSHTGVGAPAPQRPDTGYIDQSIDTTDMSTSQDTMTADSVYRPEDPVRGSATDQTDTIRGFDQSQGGRIDGDTTIDRTDRTYRGTEADWNTTTSSLQWRDLRIGEGDRATEGARVRVQYTGWLHENMGKGRKFDSSIDRNRDFTFTLGAGQVIRGWDEGIVGMREGGVRELLIPASLGYGEAGAGNGVIPANSTLIFEVELIEVVQ